MYITVVGDDMSVSEGLALYDTLIAGIGVMGGAVE